MKKPKLSAHDWFRAVLRGNTLVAKRGCTRRRVSIGKDTITEPTYTREGHRVLAVNVGARLLLCGTSLDQIASVEVTGIVLDGYRETLYVSVGCGAVNEGEVDVVKLCKAEEAA